VIGGRSRARGQRAHRTAGGRVLYPGTRISLDSIVYAFREGCSPESIRDDFEGLTLAHVYGAIAFYRDLQADIDAYLVQRRAQWAEFESQGNPASPELKARLERARGSVSLPRQ